MNSDNLFFHRGHVDAQLRVELFGHQSACLWLTGLSGSGKSTLAYGVELALLRRGIASYVLDGDNIRKGLNSDLRFSDEDRKENIRRMGEVARLFSDAGLIVLASLISPFRSDRESVRKLFHEGSFIEIFVKADLETCLRRDPKGLYKKAAGGDIVDFTGFGSRYEEPLDPELVIDTSGNRSVDDSVNQIVRYLESKVIIPATPRR